MFTTTLSEEMKKLIKNYTTDVPTDRTISEIQKMLAENGATGIAFDYDDTGTIKAVYFRIKHGEQELAFRLPAKADKVYATLYTGKNLEWKFKQQRMESATKIAWRVCKLWLEAQLTHVNLDQAKLEEVFLPYMVVNGNQTLFEQMEERQFLLPSKHAE